MAPIVFPRLATATLSMACLGALAACGGKAPESARDAAAGPDQGSNTGEDASLASDGDAGARDGARADAGQDAAEGATSCDDLQQAANMALAPVLRANAGCHADSDCFVTYVGDDGLCAAVCGVVTTDAGAGEVRAAAGVLCQPFRAQGCPPPVVPCIRWPPLVCSDSLCTDYNVYATVVSPGLVHGECGTLALRYKDLVDAGGAPHDLSVRLTANGGTLYADTGCTTAFDGGAVVLPGGAASVDVGFVPTAAGRCGIDVDDAYNGFTAQ